MNNKYSIGQTVYVIGQKSSHPEIVETENVIDDDSIGCTITFIVRCETMIIPIVIKTLEFDIINEEYSIENVYSTSEEAEEIINKLKEENKL